MSKERDSGGTCVRLYRLARRALWFFLIGIVLVRHGSAQVPSEWDACQYRTDSIDAECPPCPTQSPLNPPRTPTQEECVQGGGCPTAVPSATATSIQECQLSAEDFLRLCPNSPRHVGSIQCCTARELRGAAAVLGQEAIDAGVSLCCEQHTPTATPVATATPAATASATRTAIPTPTIVLPGTSTRTAVPTSTGMPTGTIIQTATPVGSMPTPTVVGSTATPVVLACTQREIINGQPDLCNFANGQNYCCVDTSQGPARQVCCQQTDLLN